MPRFVFSVTDGGMGVFRDLVRLGLEETGTFSSRIQLKHCHFSAQVSVRSP